MSTYGYSVFFNDLKHLHRKNWVQILAQTLPTRPFFWQVFAMPSIKGRLGQGRSGFSGRGTIFQYNTQEGEMKG